MPYFLIFLVPEFVIFMKNIEDTTDLKEYIDVYLNPGTWASNYFNKEYLKKRSEYLVQLRKVQAQNDDLCNTTPAIIPPANKYTSRTR